MKPIQVRVSGKVPAQVKQPPAKAKAKSSEPTQGGFDLQEFLDQMNKKFGTGSVIRASEAIGLKLKYLSTGCARLDLALGGGWPQNRMTEMFGSESAGKTTLIRSIVGALAFDGGDKNAIELIAPSLVHWLEDRIAANLSDESDYDESNAVEEV